MRILHVNGFSESEKKQKIDDIKKNIRDAILVCIVFTCLSSVNYLEGILINHSIFSLRVTLQLQTITGAMSTLTPPVQLEHPENQFRVDYIQDYASSKFDLNNYSLSTYQPTCTLPNVSFFSDLPKKLS